MSPPPPLDFSLLRSLVWHLTAGLFELEIPHVAVGVTDWSRRLVSVVVLRYTALGVLIV